MKIARIGGFGHTEKKRGVEVHLKRVSPFPLRILRAMLVLAGHSKAERESLMLKVHRCTEHTIISPGKQCERGGGGLQQSSRDSDEKRERERELLEVVKLLAFRCSLPPSPPFKILCVCVFPTCQREKHYSACSPEEFCEYFFRVCLGILH